MPSGLLIVVVNYRTAAQTIDCLRSLVGEVAPFGDCRVQIVDNASGDGSVEVIQAAIDSEGWGPWVTLLPLTHNGGFAFGNNAAIRSALAGSSPCRYVLLLNPDTVAKPGAIVELIRFMEANPQAGIAGSRLENALGEIQRSAHGAPSPLGELEGGASLGILSRWLRRHSTSPPAPSEPHECDWVSGASMIVRRKVFEDNGLLDEGYFLYFEEVDYCCRAKQRGWQVWYVPTSHVIHLEGASTGVGKRRRLPRYWFESRRRFFVKHYGILGLMAADTLWAIGRLSLSIRRVLKLGGGTRHDPERYTLDLLWGDCRALLTGGLEMRQKPEGRHA